MNWNLLKAEDHFGWSFVILLTPTVSSSFLNLFVSISFFLYLLVMQALVIQALVMQALAFLICCSCPYQEIELILAMWMIVLGMVKVLKKAMEVEVDPLPQWNHLLESQQIES